MPIPSNVSVSAGNKYDLSVDSDRIAAKAGVTVKMRPFIQDTDALLTGSSQFEFWGASDSVNFFGSALSGPTTVTYPLRLRFLFLQSNGCTCDTRNVIGAVTTALISQEDFQTRRGLIARISGFRSPRVVVFAYRLVTSVATEPESIQMIFSGEADARGIHRSQFEVGDFCS